MKTNINKPIFNQNLAEKFIDKSFNELKKVETSNTLFSTNGKINELFSLYDELFYSIPKIGNQSHTTLITRSTEYVGSSEDSDLINSLLSEINDLKSQNNILNQTLQQILNNK